MPPDEFCSVLFCAAVGWFGGEAGVFSLFPPAASGRADAFSFLPPSVAAGEADAFSFSPPPTSESVLLSALAPPSLGVVSESIFLSPSPLSAVDVGVALELDSPPEVVGEVVSVVLAPPPVVGGDGVVDAGGGGASVLPPPPVTELSSPTPSL